MRNVIYYAATFQNESNIPFMHAWTSDITSNMFSSKSLHTGSSSTYLRYACVDKLMMNHGHLVTFAGKLASTKEANSFLVISHIDDC